MGGWNVWARERAAAVWAPVWPWMSEPLREARGIGEFDPQRKDYPQPRRRGRIFRETDVRRALLPVSGRAGVPDLLAAVAHGGGKAPETPIFGSGGACGAPCAAQVESQVVAAVEVTANPGNLGEGHMHHNDAGEQSAGALSATGALRPRVTDDEIARVLTYVECGYSLRQAAAAVGRNHASVLRCVRRSPELTAAYRQKQQLAREQPLRQLHEASQRSWRAAAWLLTYLDRRDTPRRTKHKNNDQPTLAPCPKSDTD